MDSTQTNATTPTMPQPIMYQKPLFIHSSLASSIADIPNSSASIPNRSMSVVSDRARKHYSDNLYNVLDNGIAARRSGRSTIGVCNPILESMSSMQKMLITKQALRSCESDKKMKKEVKFHLESVDENLDIADPFQNPGFSLNIRNPRVIEFKMDYFNGVDLDESLVRNFSKIDESLELKFNNKSFGIDLTEGEITKSIGNVSLMNQSYHVFDANGNYMFQLEKRMNQQGQDQLVAVRKVEGQRGEMEMGRADLGGWKRLTLETEVVYGSACSAKEKLMILAAVLVVMIKMTAKNVTRSEAGNEACSVGGLWKNWMRKMRAIF